MTQGHAARKWWNQDFILENLTLNSLPYYIICGSMMQNYLRERNKTINNHLNTTGISKISSGILEQTEQEHD